MPATLMQTTTDNNAGVRKDCPDFHLWATCEHAVHCHSERAVAEVFTSPCSDRDNRVRYSNDIWTAPTLSGRRTCPIKNIEQQSIAEGVRQGFVAAQAN